MTTSSKSRIQVPLVRLNLALPFLQAAKDDGLDVTTILEPFKITEQDFDNSEKFVTAAVMHGLVEALADGTGDPHLGAKLGRSLNPFSWSPLTDAASQANSVGDLLLRFSIDAYKDASSVVFRLDTQGTRSTFTEQRLVEARQLLRHNDAFGVSYILSILESAVGDSWDGRRVVISVCDPSALPANYLGTRIAKSTGNSFSVSFPCEWLLLEPGFKPKKTATTTSSQATAPDQTRPSLQLVLQSHLHEHDLNADRVAELCGTSKRTLARRLAELDTSLKAELDALRQAKAEAALSKNDQTISQVGQSVGYNDPSVFARAFKLWTGMTPVSYRKHNDGKSQ